MKWKKDNIQSKAEAQGELVYAMEQSLTRGFVMKKMTPGACGHAPSAGVCGGLVLRWIGLRQRGEDYPFDPATLWFSAPFWEAVCDQKLSNKLNSVDGFLVRVRGVLHQYGVVPNMGRYTNLAGSVSAERIERAVFAGDGLYYIEMRRDDPELDAQGKLVIDAKGKPKRILGGHVIAVERAGTEYRLFDGNRGHFLLKGRDRFLEFMKEFLTETGYETRYVAGFYVVGFNAPPAKAPPVAKSVPFAVTFKAGRINHQYSSPTAH